MNIPLVLLVIGLVLLITPFIICWLDYRRGTQLSCRFGWHDGRGDNPTFDGCSYGNNCSKCGVRVLLDSQGNWFEVSNKA